MKTREWDIYIIKYKREIEKKKLENNMRKIKRIKIRF